MRFLKNKIARAHQLDKNLHTHHRPDDEESLTDLSDDKRDQTTRTLRIRPEKMSSPPKAPTKKGTTSSLNIVKNYSRAMTNFALSDLAKPYLMKIVPEMGNNLQGFLDFVDKRKDSVNCIKKLRGMLPLGINDKSPNYVNKIIFQEICIIFLKIFSVNWIFSSKVNDKIAHLNCRFKILRRIKSPDQFTYLRSFNEAF